MYIKSILLWHRWLGELSNESPGGFPTHCIFPILEKKRWASIGGEPVSGFTRMAETSPASDCNLGYNFEEGVEGGARKRSWGWFCAVLCIRGTHVMGIYLLGRCALVEVDKPIKDAVTGDVVIGPRGTSGGVSQRRHSPCSKKNLRDRRQYKHVKGSKWEERMVDARRTTMNCISSRRQ